MRTTKLTMQQIDEILESRLSEETWAALKRFVYAEKERRLKAGVRGGRPRKYAGTLAERKVASAQAKKKA